jgi:hypothetical protein
MYKMMVCAVDDSGVKLKSTDKPVDILSLLLELPPTERLSGHNYSSQDQQWRNGELSCMRSWCVGRYALWKAHMRLNPYHFSFKRWHDNIETENRRLYPKADDFIFNAVYQKSPRGKKV